MVTINISFQEGGLFFFWKVLFCPFKWNMVDCSAVNSRFSDPGTIIAGIGLTLVLLTEVDCGFKSTIDFCQQSECKPNTSNWCAERPFRGPRWREPQTRHGHWQRNWTSTGHHILPREFLILLLFTQMQIETKIDKKSRDRPFSQFRLILKF